MSSGGDDGTTSTTMSSTFLWRPTTPVRQQFNGYNMPLDITTYGVPLAFTVLVVLILCVVIAYTKAKRRRLRQQLGPRNNLRSISGGVPMSVAAYRNYGMHLAAGDQGPAGYPRDLPPPYEVAIQTPPSSTNSQSYPPAVSLLPAPPAYTETFQQQQPSINTTPSSQGAAPAPSATPTPAVSTQPALQAPPDSSTVHSGGHREEVKDTEEDKKDSEGHPPQVDASGQPTAPKPDTSGQPTAPKPGPSGGEGATTTTTTAAEVVTPSGGGVHTPSTTTTTTTSQDGSQL